MRLLSQIQGCWARESRCPGLSPGSAPGWVDPLIQVPVLLVSINSHSSCPTPQGKTQEIWLASPLLPRSDPAASCFPFASRGSPGCTHCAPSGRPAPGLLVLSPTCPPTPPSTAARAISKITLILKKHKSSHSNVLVSYGCCDKSPPLSGFKHTNVSSYSSRGQKSETGYWGCVPFPPSRGRPTAGLTAPPCITLTFAPVITSPLMPILPPPTY